MRTFQEFAQQLAKAEFRDSLKGTMAGKVTQREVLEAFERIPPESNATVWLSIDADPNVELVDYTLSPVGTPPPGLVNDFTLPMALSRAEAAVIAPGLPLRKPLWLVGISTGGLAGKWRIFLQVRRAYGPGSRLVPSEKPSQARRAADQMLRIPAIEIERLRDAGNDCGALKGERWVLVPNEKADGLPALYVPQEFSTARAGNVTDGEWAELYARLVLGEEVEDT